MTDTAFIIRRPRRASTSQAGRFEYRVWPRASHPAASLLHRHWPLTDAERRSDIYLVHPASDQTLIKLRGGRRLEIKRRDRDVGTIQHWSMLVSTEFPMTAARRRDLALALSLREDLPQTAGLSPAHLLMALNACDSQVVPQTVQKSRLLFRTGDRRAEICRVTIAGWRGLTISLEAPDLTSIATSLDELHLGQLPNRSYGEALVRFASLHTRFRGLLSTP